MAYPASPTNGQIYGNKKYNSTKGAWEFILDNSIIQTSGTATLIGTSTDRGGGDSLQVVNGSNNKLSIRNSDYIQGGSVGTIFIMGQTAVSGNTSTSLNTYTTGGAAWGNTVLQTGGGAVIIGSSTADTNGEALQVAGNIGFGTQRTGRIYSDAN